MDVYRGDEDLLMRLSQKTLFKKTLSNFRSSLNRFRSSSNSVRNPSDKPLSNEDDEIESMIGPRYPFRSVTPQKKRPILTPLTGYFTKTLYSLNKVHDS